MPIYEYEHDTPGTCDVRFQVLQNLDEESLASCPECGKPVHRVISTASFSMQGRVTPDQAASKGFTTYRRAEKGVYEKVAGEGSDTLKAD